MSKKNKKVTKIQYKMIEPFGPSIMQGKMPDVVFNEFEKCINEVLEKKDNNHGESLAGRIDDEWFIDEGYLKFSILGPFLDNVVSKYAAYMTERSAKNGMISEPTGEDGTIRTGINTTRVSGWVNSMSSGEYNPVHYHPGCNITTVFFFDSIDEEFIDEIIAPSQTDSFTFGKNKYKKGTTDDGVLSIFYNSAHYYEHGTWSYRPLKGDFLIFPSWLLHGVYPFKSEKRRRTVSINYIVESNNQHISFGLR
mgnify:FL=1